MSDASAFKSKPGLGRVAKAAIYSMQGLKVAWKNEVAFRQELTLAAVMFPAALLLDVSLLEKLALIGTLVFVLVVELLNSAVEAVVDRFGSELHPLSGNAKDLGSAAVFLSLLFALAVWASILWKNFGDRIAL